MKIIPAPLEPLRAYRQWILWTITPDGKKLPINPHTGGAASSTDPNTWTDADSIILAVERFGPSYHIGFVFTRNDPFFFLDIDDALHDGQWSQTAHDIIGVLSNGAIEVSHSGTGLHMIGTSAPFEHACKNIPLHLELYTENRFIALTGDRMGGSAVTDLTAQLAPVVTQYFPVKTATAFTWSDAPDPTWNGPTDDVELLTAAVSSRSAGSVFGSRASFADLWTANIDVLAVAYPPNADSISSYDASSADAALFQHLAFWTGKNCERMRRLAEQSALFRDKWSREDYLYRTVINACSMQTEIYGAKPVIDHHGGKLRATSDKQRDFADKIRADKITECNGDATIINSLLATTGPQSSAKFWIENRARTPQELQQMTQQVETIVPPVNVSAAAPVTTVQRVHGLQYLTADLQEQFFCGCTYVQDIHRIFTPDGSVLKPDQFNATYGGYIFQLDDSGEKTTRKAWEAFTESQVFRFPKVSGMCFRPQDPPGQITLQDGRQLVNVYVPVPVPRQVGDVSPFTGLMCKILPEQRDRDILMAYMSACVQYKGVKFKWAPLLQGVEGNGKTLFTRCVMHAVGKRYTHFPKAADLDNKFNLWLLNNLLIGVEDIYVPDNRQGIVETLKPMITGEDGHEIQGKNADQFTADICANFMLNSNHRNAVRKTDDARRFCIFYTAQQEATDLKRDGMTGDYFPKLYKWLRAEGYAIVSEFLHTYAIPDELNPAGSCHRAPETSTTWQAIAESAGAIEQEILEAIGEGRPGFAGGWISSMALDRLLKNLRAERRIPQNKRRDILKTLGYDWHPALSNGRVNNFIPFDGGKPKLFIKEGHLSQNLTTAVEVAHSYERAQGFGNTEDRAREVFK